MGMFDTFYIEDNIFGLPRGEYQTKCLECSGDRYKISHNGEIILVYFNDGIYWSSNNLPKNIPTKIKGINGNLFIYSVKSNDNIDYTFELTVKNGIITYARRTNTCYDNPNSVDINFNYAVYEPL